MISYISGVVEEIEKDKVVVDNNGIGYGIFASHSTLEQIGIGEQVKIYTYFSVREDAMQLYGFLSRQELQLFKLLIGVSGVGPKGGLAILSTCPGDSLSMAVLADDAKAISKAPGIGAKTAQKIIIELKDKIDDAVKSKEKSYKRKLTRDEKKRVARKTIRESCCYREMDDPVEIMKISKRRYSEKTDKFYEYLIKLISPRINEGNVINKIKQICFNISLGLFIISMILIFINTIVYIYLPI